MSSLLGMKRSVKASPAKRPVEALKGAMGRTGLEPFVMPSGGGHDAAVFAAAGVPSVMVFVRNRNGSHNPDEAMDLQDFMGELYHLRQLQKSPITILR